MPAHTQQRLTPAAQRYTCVPLAAGQSAGELLGHLAELYRSRLQIETDTTIAVIFARKAGLSWEQIARQMLLNEDAAWERWGRHIKDDG